MRVGEIGWILKLLVGLLYLLSGLHLCVLQLLRALGVRQWLGLLELIILQLWGCLELLSRDLQLLGSRLHRGRLQRRLGVNDALLLLGRRADFVIRHLLGTVVTSRSLLVELIKLLAVLGRQLTLVLLLWLGM